ncbi:Phosphoglycolate phosphatase [Planctomycetes bacterium MalM25]|nr:Phosphoglycolate phosphatase [Planctomycetes bacterium MalM25]
MQLVILHHHLNRGGVTSVIVNHLRALATLPEEERPERVVVFFDGQRDGWPDDLPRELSIAEVDVPELGYDAPGVSSEPEQLADLLSERFDACGLQPGDTLLHVHNHALGKNASLPRALEHLAGEGWRMLLQVHDFAEDNRPENYRHLQEAIGVDDPATLGEILYPQGERVQYATLTERDADILRNAGVDAPRLHTLPNPVAEFTEMPGALEAKARVYVALGLPAKARLIVYPVRGIRRKNLGEMLLLAALAPEETYFAVTLRPKNPSEAESFDRWRRLAESLDLPCLFDTGSPRAEGGYGCDFQETLAAAEAILTTSIAEGFGMVFLEAWLAGKPLIGRDLPEITREFKAAGMRYDGMWDELRAPANLDEDFARLTPGEQIAAIRGTRRPEAPVTLIDAPEGLVAANAAIVRERYSTAAIGERLAAVYQRVESADAPAASEFHGERIVEHFADPARQFPVRVETPLDDGADDLIAAIAQLSHPLTAQKTGEEPVLPAVEGIRAVVFDVYGTLLISGSGDISLASEGSRGAAAIEALQAAASEPATSVVGVEAAHLVPPTTDVAGSPLDGDVIVSALHEAVLESHQASKSEHPEVEIRDLWRSVIEQLSLRISDDQVERFAIEYECRVNPIWPMPGLAETLTGLNNLGIELGIVSNAQFFTPLAFEPLTGKSLGMWGFDESLGVWSYEHREAKPGLFLYERCAAALAERGIEPGEALFVGNDLRNDIWPAARVGFKTALFAGDARSLRWRRDDARLADVRPDAVVTDLRQLLQIAL